MFMGAHLEGHIDVLMPQKFNSVTNCTHMFRDNPGLTSINFDVSNIDSCFNLFEGCSGLTNCTGAKFKEKGYYQNMFASSKFNESSVEKIWKAARSASLCYPYVGSQLTDELWGSWDQCWLHIGMAGQPSATLQEKLHIIKDTNGEWIYGEVTEYAYCHCHHMNYDECVSTSKQKVIETKTFKDNCIVIRCN